MTMSFPAPSQMRSNRLTNLRGEARSRNVQSSVTVPHAQVRHAVESRRLVSHCLPVKRLDDLRRASVARHRALRTRASESSGAGC